MTEEHKVWRMIDYPDQKDTVRQVGDREGRQNSNGLTSVGFWRYQSGSRWCMSRGAGKKIRPTSHLVTEYVSDII